MTWETFYDEYDGMSDAARDKMIRALRDFGLPQEIVRCACDIGPGQQADLLIGRALQSGVSFDAKETVTLCMLLSEKTADRTVDRALEKGETFDTEQIRQIAETVSAAVLEKVIGNYEQAEPSDKKEIQKLKALLEEKKNEEEEALRQKAQGAQEKKKGTIEGFHRPPEKRGINERFAILLGFLATVAVAVIVILILAIIFGARACSRKNSAAYDAAGRTEIFAEYPEVEIEQNLDQDA